MNLNLPKLSVLTAIMISHISSMAQTTTPDVRQRPSTPAHKIESAPVIDGNILTDELWQSISAIVEMTQTRPNNGEPVSEKTEVRIAYTTSHFYLSVVCYDTEPDKLVVSDMRRDANLDDTDAFLFILDTYHDGQNGFMFGTNSQGIEYDAQVDNEGQGNFNNNRQQGGMIGGFNLNWDASWEVKTEVGNYGWSAEFAIPFKTLRFNPGNGKTWGFNFQRIIRKNNEVAYWAPMPIQFDLKRLSLEGTLTELDLQNPGNLKLIPYSLINFSKNNTLENPKTEDSQAVGLDIKYNITPNMTLDLTYNTDFAQVEVDEQQVNLDRFNLFFPEKRPFFLENAGLFSIGSPGEVDLFFSRRIGLGRDSLGNLVQIPILGGARLSGRIDNTNLGILNITTDKIEEQGATRNNFTVARVNHQIGSRSTIGAAFINKDVLETDTAYNRVVALDSKIGIGKKAQVSGYLAKSNTPGIDSNDMSFRIQGEYEWDGLIMNTSLTDVGTEFNPEVGFLGRSGGFRKYEGLILKQIRPEDFIGILELRPHVSYRGYWNSDESLFSNGFQQTGFLHVDNHWEWKSGFEVHTGMNFTREGVEKPFYINKADSTLQVNSGNYSNSEAQLVLMTNTSKPFYFSNRSVVGGYYDGNRTNTSGTMGMRIGDKFNTEIKYGINIIRHAEGNFTTQVYGARISYSFTPRINAQSLIQYNSLFDQYSANIRFSMLQQANTGLFLVFNELRQSGKVLFRGFTVKYSHIIEVNSR